MKRPSVSPLASSLRLARLARLALVASLALAAGCDEDPDVDQGLAPEPSSVISGSAVVAVPIPDAHPAILFLSLVADAEGTPLAEPAKVDVTVVSASLLAEGGDGVRTGPFTFGLVTPGVYVVTGLVDVDDNFNLLVPELAAPSAADLLGAYADVTTGQPISILLGPDQVVGEVTVMFAIPPPSDQTPP
ncbi:MAG TPA: hypothetical protein VKB80_00175 [Kofleriaceae bacterium]|nr:hypothetical protein [Kofleriaceae bacterium]